MSQALFDKIESEQLRAEPLKFRVGDIVKVHTKVKEGGKERTQVFQGIVLKIRGRGLNATFTVRRISCGEDFPGKQSQRSKGGGGACG